MLGWVEVAADGFRLGKPRLTILGGLRRQQDNIRRK